MLSYLCIKFNIYFLFSYLLNFCEVVVGVSVKDKLSERNQRIVGMGPDLGHIKDVPLVGGSLSLGHDLSIAGPGGSFSGFEHLVIS
jgi:hypothetical protein